jgi:RecA/RadA recombinase
MPPRTTKKKKEETIEIVKDRGTTYLSTGILSLDVSLGGGFSEGAFHGLFSVESGGKTTTCVNIMRSALAKYPDKKVLYVQTETGGITKDRMREIGVDVERVDLLEEMSEESIEGMLIKKVTSPYNLSNNTYSLVVIDSINNITNDYDLSTQGTGFSRSASFIGKLLKILGTAVVRRSVDASETPLTVIATMQASANMDVNSFKKWLPKGGKALMHCMSSIVRFSSNEVTFASDVDATIRMNNATEYKMKYLKNHPIVNKISSARKPLFLVNVSYEKHRGMFLDSCAYLISNLDADLLPTVPEIASLRKGREYLPITLYDLVSKNIIGLRKGNGEIPAIGVKTSSKDNLIKTLSFGVEVGTGVVVDYDKLIKYIIVKMRFEMSLQSKGLELLPDDNYLCGRFFDREEFLAIAEELREKEMPVLEMSLADYANEILGLTN